MLGFVVLRRQIKFIILDRIIRMFLYASKILLCLIYPLGLSVLLLIAAFLLKDIKKKKVFNTLFLSSVLILYLFSITPVSDLLSKPLKTNLSANITNLKADGVVVLAGGKERIITGIRLIKQKAAPVIIIAGGTANIFDQNIKPAVLMKEFAIEFGVPSDRIITETESRNTRENAVNTKRILDKLNAKKVILVTSDYHMRRAHAVFKKIGIDAIPFEAKYYLTDKERKYDPLSFLPKAGNLYISTRAVHEYLAIIMYGLRGWL